MDEHVSDSHDHLQSNFRMKLLVKRSDEKNHQRLLILYI